MYPSCPKCNEKDKIKVEETKVLEIKCKCLVCGEVYRCLPTKEFMKEFNG
jgi:hypothetical protein